MSGLPDPSLVRDLTDEFPQTRRILIAYSGGLDSRVLLHLACRAVESLSVPLLAIHVDHGLQDKSSAWAKTCEKVCRESGVPLTVLKADITPDKSQSLEAQARDARYSLFKSQLQKGDLLLLAHHADDQAETVFLQLLRGAGPPGLAAMPRVREFESAKLVRPLIACSRKSLEEYAREHALNWIDDPSNDDRRFDRNFLRHEIFPKLQSRFPAFRQTIARSARHNAEAADFLRSVGEADLALCLNPVSNSLSLNELRKRKGVRLKNLLRCWISQSGFLAPHERQLQTLIKTIESAEPACDCSLDNSDFAIRQYREDLYVMAKPIEFASFEHPWPDTNEILTIPELNLELDKLSLEQAGIRLPESGQILVRNRIGGEKMRLGNPAKHRILKKIFQENAVPQWRRDQYPLIFCDGKLIAIPGLAIDPDYTC